MAWAWNKDVLWSQFRKPLEDGLINDGEVSSPHVFSGCCISVIFAALSSLFLMAIGKPRERGCTYAAFPYAHYFQDRDHFLPRWTITSWLLWWPWLCWTRWFPAAATSANISGMLLQSYACLVLDVMLIQEAKNAFIFFKSSSELPCKTTTSIC